MNRFNKIFSLLFLSAEMTFQTFLLDADSRVVALGNLGNEDVEALAGGENGSISDCTYDPNSKKA